MRPAWNSRYSYKESNKVSYEGRFSPVYPSFKGKLLPSASSECCWALSAFYPQYILERSIAVPSMTSAFTRELERLVVAQVSATLSFLFTTHPKDSNSHTSLAGLHKFRDGWVRSSRCFSWIAFAARRYYPSLRQHFSSKVNTFWMYCFPYSTVSPTTWSVVTHEHGCRGAIMRCNLQQGHVLTHSLRHKPGQGRTILNIRDVISALGDVDLCVVQVLRNVGAFEVPFAHALPPRLQLRRLPKVSSNL